MGRVRAAAAGPETVDGEGDRGREVGRVAGAAAARADDRPPERAGRRLEQRRGGLARVHPRPLAHELGLQARAAELRRERLQDAVEGVEAVGAQVADQLADAGHDVEGVADVEHRRHRGEALGARGDPGCPPPPAPPRPAPAAR